jgi:putative DNA primase/helicase
VSSHATQPTTTAALQGEEDARQPKTPPKVSPLAYMPLANVLRGLPPGPAEDLPVKYLDAFMELVTRPPLVAFEELVRQAESDPELLAGLATAMHGTAPPEFTLDDTANAARLVWLWGWRLCYLHEAERWLVWDGRRWCDDATGTALRLTETVAAAYRRDAFRLPPDSEELRRQAEKRLAHAHGCLSRQKRRDMLDLAQVERGVTRKTAEFDRDPWMLNVQNGTVDLRTGELRPHRAEDRLTTLAGAAHDPAATCPTWERFLYEVFGGDAELVKYLQRAVGYTLTGSIKEQVFMILHGSGANGKSTLLETLHVVLGDYALHANAESFIASDRRDQKRDDLAALRGARLVSASETGENQRLDERSIKEICGGEAITCRHLHGRYFSYHPTFKLWMATNHRPVIRGTDHAIWRRIHLLPFLQSFKGERCDPDLPEKLRAELPGILAWAVDGCLAWQMGGLRPPPVVCEAVEAYRSDSDTVGLFLAECCVVSPEFTVKSGDLNAAFTRWAESNGYRALNPTALAARLKEKGIEKSTVKGYPQWRGVGLRGEGR